MDSDPVKPELRCLKAIAGLSKAGRPPDALCRRTGSRGEASGCPTAAKGLLQMHKPCSADRDYRISTPAREAESASGGKVEDRYGCSSANDTRVIAEEMVASPDPGSL